jgi:hypothetical protein
MEVDHVKASPTVTLSTTAPTYDHGNNGRPKSRGSVAGEMAIAISIVEAAAAATVTNAPAVAAMGTFSIGTRSCAKPVRTMGAPSRAQQNMALTIRRSCSASELVVLPRAHA